MSRLFAPFRLRGTRFKNRIFVSPMCEYSAIDGVPTEWHLVHLGSRAVGGAALVMTEATAVSPEGRISPEDTGIWNDQQAEVFGRIAAFIRSQNAVPGIQLAHAGRKGSTEVPWRGGRAIAPEAPNGWEPVGPGPMPFHPGDPPPRAMTRSDVDEVVIDFAAAAGRALDAGFEVVELHMAHGYLLHEFLSPITNQRSDEYGGSLGNRMRFPIRVAEAVRAVWPVERPLFVRISASDWIDGGWDIGSSIALAKRLKVAGVDLIDCSSGGIAPGIRIPVGPGYQVPFAEAVKHEGELATVAVGMITEARQAEEIIGNGRADAVMLARELLRDPYWPLHAAKELGVDVPWPQQYERAK
jgi:2,4-dienoyl-CoA reductase-like NADH-dependent reductase (Old Yellow Enzyme family)